ncbi:hypothetical protein KAH85_00215 [Candidatus Bathyarchaeota archaeon]|nr:hypothetical protein [Candidatus Bathyarchaeota archaeon]
MISSDKQTPVALNYPEMGKNAPLIGESVWLSRKMVDEGCSLQQTLHTMEERCKTCNAASPLICVEQCGTWRVKRELRDIHSGLRKKGHEETLLNALKNRRRFATLRFLRKRAMTITQLQKELKSIGFHHSREVISQYLKPLLITRLVREDENRFELTLYGRKIIDAVKKFSIQGRLPISSVSYDEKVIRYLLNDPASRNELLTIIPSNSLARTLKRLLEHGILKRSSPPYRVFYFRTKRSLSLEILTPTQMRICDSIPVDGISASGLSKSAGINLRRIYKHLRTLRGKKLVFRRSFILKYALTPEGQQIGSFLGEISSISRSYLGGFSCGNA